MKRTTLIKNLIFESTSAFIMWIPSLIVRRLYLRCFLAEFGKSNYIARNVDIREPHNIHMGSNNVINKRVVLDGRGGLIISNNVDIAQDTMIWTEQHLPNDNNHGTEKLTVIIEDYVWIASRVTILPGRVIHKGAVIATGSIVTKDVPEMSVVAGVPAKIISKRKNELRYILDFHPIFRI